MLYMLHLFCVFCEIPVGVCGQLTSTGFSSNCSTSITGILFFTYGNQCDAVCVCVCVGEEEEEERENGKSVIVTALLLIGKKDWNWQLQN